MADGKRAEGAEPTIRRLGLPGDLGWVVMAHGELYAAEFGWDAALEALIIQIVADYAAGHDSHREAAWIAEFAGRRVGSIFCVGDPEDETTAKLRALLVEGAGRGRGLGGLLLDAALAFARTSGYARARLWTNHPLAAARHLYLSRGFELIAEEPHHSFGVDLIGQVYELPLG
ncbi:MAG TPA: GNAT family N-acetyltransferase [Solirubrobacteraceae bacterium]|jgi:GNAT superfamily N-acetyltransferase|nr:GNAT family N-acetyltransferase [Solirubrobacteraceae bacterium]